MYSTATHLVRHWRVQVRVHDAGHKLDIVSRDNGLRRTGRQTHLSSNEIDDAQGLKKHPAGKEKGFRVRKTQMAKAKGLSV